MLSLIKRLFKKKTVATILYAHSKTIEALEKFADKKFIKADKIADKLNALTALRAEATTEARLANKIAGNMKKVLEG